MVEGMNIVMSFSLLYLLSLKRILNIKR